MRAAMVVIVAAGAVLAGCSSPEVDAYCDARARMRGAMEAGVTTSEDLGSAIDAMVELGATAPEELAADYAVLTGGLETLRPWAEQQDAGTATWDDFADEVVAVLDDPAVSAASERIDAYGAEHC